MHTMHTMHNHTESSEVKSPCQIDSGANNNSILVATSHQDTVSTNFRLFCNRTFDVASSVPLMQFAIPDSIANMNGCMEACLDHNAGGSNTSNNEFNDSCYAVTINKNETTGQQWFKLFSATEWGVDAIEADCAVNLSLLSLSDTTIFQTSNPDGIKASIHHLLMNKFITRRIFFGEYNDNSRSLR